MPIHPQTAPRSEERGAVRARSRASPGGSPLPPREQRKHLLGEGHEAGSRRWSGRDRRAGAPRPPLAPPSHLRRGRGLRELTRDPPQTQTRPFRDVSRIPRHCLSLPLIFFLLTENFQKPPKNAV